VAWGALGRPGESRTRQRGHWGRFVRARCGPDERQTSARFSAGRRLSELDPHTESVEVATAHEPGVFFEAIATTNRSPRLHEILHDALWSLPVAGVVAGMLAAAALRGEPLALRLVGSCLVFSAFMLLMVQPLRRWLRRRRDRAAPLR
jgi:hypothetical protein